MIYLFIQLYSENGYHSMMIQLKVNLHMKWVLDYMSDADNFVALLQSNGPVKVHTLWDFFLELPTDLQHEVIKRSDTGSWATSGWLYAEGVLYICWRTFSFDGPICALVHLFATSPCVQEVYIYNIWGLPEDWGYILRICCLIPLEKLALSNAYYACCCQSFLKTTK